MKRLPIGIQTFRDIVQNDYLYVDKTEKVFDLVKNPNGDKDQALNQIKDKRYFEKYQGKGEKIYLFGVEFADRNVGEWVVENV